MRQSAQLDQMNISSALAALQNLNESQGLHKPQASPNPDRKAYKQRNTVSFQGQDQNQAHDSSALQKDIQKLVCEMKAQEEKKSRQSFSSNLNESNRQPRQSQVDLEYIDRFEQHISHKEQWLNEEKQRSENKRMSFVQPAPHISEKSRKLNERLQENPPLWQRSIQMHSTLQTSKENTLQNLKLQKNKADLNQCTFKPTLVSTPSNAKSKLFEKKKQNPVEKPVSYSFKPQLNKKSMKMASNIKEKPGKKKGNQSMEKIGSTKPHMNSKSRKMVEKYGGGTENKQTYLYDNYMTQKNTGQKNQSYSSEKLNTTHNLTEAYKNDDFHSIITKLRNVHD